VKRIEQLLRAADRFQQQHGVLGFPVGVVKKYGDDDAGKHAALLAYYGFLSLFPLLLVFVTALGYALADNRALQQRVIDTVIANFPGFGLQIQDSIKTIEGSGLGLVVGILGTLWGGLGITQSAQDAMNAVWNIPRKDRPNLWWRLARGLGSLLLVAVGVFAATALAQLGTSRPGVLSRLPFGGSMLLNLLLLASLFQVLTAKRVPWRRLLPGAAVGAVGWSVLQAGADGAGRDRGTPARADRRGHVLPRGRPRRDAPTGRPLSDGRAGDQTPTLTPWHGSDQSPVGHPHGAFRVDVGPEEAAPCSFLVWVAHRRLLATIATLMGGSCEAHRVTTGPSLVDHRRRGGSAARLLLRLGRQLRQAGNHRSHGRCRSVELRRCQPEDQMRRGRATAVQLGPQPHPACRARRHQQACHRHAPDPPANHAWWRCSA
jgi:YihY family inner membrane protein